MILLIVVKYIYDIESDNMNRKTKIIVNVTGIILIILMLLSLTYGYFMTKVKGNTNTKSIQASSAKKIVEYTDLSEEISGKIIEPGYETIKIFTVKNIGTTSATYHIYLDNVINDFIRTQDIIYTLYRKEGNNTIDTANLSESDIVASGIFPQINNYILINENIETPNNYYTYALKINYINSEEIQDEDQGHTFSFKVQIKGDYGTTLASNIFNNSKNKINGTELLSSPITEVANEINATNEKILTQTNDDYGKSYYYRGNVIDNYVDFAEMCWRIVRISGDGSIKLILEDQDNTCANSDGNWNIPINNRSTTTSGNFGYTSYAVGTLTASDGTTNTRVTSIMDYLNGGTNNDKSMATAFKNFQISLSKKIGNKDLSDYLKAGDWCLGDTAYATISDNTTPLTSQEIIDREVKGTTFYYDSRIRLGGKTTKEPTLKCLGTKMTMFGDDTTNMYVGTLTADEVVFAGLKIYTENTNNYLINDYQNSKSFDFWIITPSGFTSGNGGAFSFFLNQNGSLNDENNVGTSRAFRPSINLKFDIAINSGDGTKTNPYTIK